MFFMVYICTKSNSEAMGVLMGALMGASACAYIRLRTLRTASYMLFASFRAPRCTAYVTVTCQDLLPEICFTVYDFRDLAKHFCGTEASKQEKTM